MKYRKLTEEELVHLEKEFVDFLVVNGIDADTYEKEVRSDTEKYAKITEAFSDVVFEKILRDTRYLMHRSSDRITAIQCGNAVFSIISIHAPNISDTLPLEELLRDDASDIHIGSKVVTDRQEEIWKLMEQGYAIDDSRAYESMLEHIKTSDD